MNTDEQSIQLLRALARRLADDPQFMAHVLSVYQRQAHLDEAALARELGAAPELLLRLALCRRPVAHAPDFAAQVRALADYTLLDATRLAHLLRGVEELSAAPVCAGQVKAAWPQRLWGWLGEGARSLGETIALRPLASSAIAAVLLLSVLSGLLGWVAWRAYRPAPAPQVAQQQHTPQPVPASPTPATENALRKAAPSTAPAKNVQEIALEDWAPQREVGAPGEKRPITIKPPLERVELRLRLLESWSRGTYRVAILGADDQPLKTRQAYSRDGINLAVMMNLSRLVPGNYRLRVGRVGEAFVECSLRIVKPKATLK
jgi:hypothetical protein